jgi:hypothetical protein
MLYLIGAPNFNTLQSVNLRYLDKSSKNPNPNYVHASNKKFFDTPHDHIQSKKF